MQRVACRIVVPLLAEVLWPTSLATARETAMLAPPAPPLVAAPKRAPDEPSLPPVQAPASKRAPGWVLAKPPRSTQTSKSSRERGINPCLVPDPGFGAYDGWDRAPSMGQMIVPEEVQLGPNGEFDVMIHFHGHESARKEWVQSLSSGVMVGIDLGNGSGPYLKALAVPGRFEKLVRSVEEAVARKAGRDHARARKVGLSAWSAGYGAVESILRTAYGRRRVDSVVLLDGLHSGYTQGQVDAAKLAPFADFARRAARGDKFMFVSHSSIVPPSYASTTETAKYLIWQVGGRPKNAEPRARDPMGLELFSQYSRGNFHVRGYSGNDKLDHCAQIAVYRDVLATMLARRWGMKTTASANASDAT